MNFRVEKFMDYDLPAKENFGINTSIQGFAVSGRFAFNLFHGGLCAVYDLEKKSNAPVGVFRLASYNVGTPDQRYINHANQAMFSDIFLEEGDEFPLLFVTTGNSGEADNDGFIGRCAVERITRAESGFSSKLVQTIIYNNRGIENTRFESPCWGWPASFTDGKFYYIFSARYRTTKAFREFADRNAYIITKFRLPGVSEKKVILTPDDILDQFTAPFDIGFTQGGTLKNGKIYYLFGAGSADYPDAMRVYDLGKREECGKLDLSATIMDGEEPECCAFYGERLLFNTNTGNPKIYEIII